MCYTFTPATPNVKVSCVSRVVLCCGVVSVYELPHDKMRGRGREEEEEVCDKQRGREEEVEVWNALCQI